jgi:hypothetical protein
MYEILLYSDNSYGYDFWNDNLILLRIITYPEVLIMYLMNMLIMF